MIKEKLRLGFNSLLCHFSMGNIRHYLISLNPSFPLLLKGNITFFTRFLGGLNGLSAWSPWQKQN